MTELAPVRGGSSSKGARPPRAPAGLAAAGRRLWRATTAEFDASNPVELVLLEEACRVADTIVLLTEALAGEGATAAGSRGQVVAHPLLRELRDERALLARLLDALHAGDADGWDNLSASQRARKAARARWGA